MPLLLKENDRLINPVKQKMRQRHISLQASKCHVSVKPAADIHFLFRSLDVSHKVNKDPNCETVLQLSTMYNSANKRSE